MYKVHAMRGKAADVDPWPLTSVNLISHYLVSPSPSPSRLSSLVWGHSQGCTKRKGRATTNPRTKPAYSHDQGKVWSFCRTSCGTPNTAGRNTLGGGACPCKSRGGRRKAETYRSRE